MFFALHIDENLWKFYNSAIVSMKNTYVDIWEYMYMYVYNDSQLPPRLSPGLNAALSLIVQDE